MLVMIVITMGLIGSAVGVRIDKCVCPGAWAAMFSHSSTSCFACTSDSFIAWHVMQTQTASYSTALGGETECQAVLQYETCDPSETYWGFHRH